jgi:hypothetical protein
MKQVILAFLLALGGQPAPPATDQGSPAALVAHQPLTPAVLLGAWLGNRVTTGATARSPLEVIFTESPRPLTIVGYFTIGEAAMAPTLRRFGSLTADHVRFDLTEGRAITLRLDESTGRLLGRLAGHGSESAIELWRLRGLGRSAPPATSAQPAGAPR